MRLYIFSTEFFAVFPATNGDHFYFVIVMFASEEVVSKYKFEMICQPKGVADSDTMVKFHGSPTSIDVDEKELFVFGTSRRFMDKMLKSSTTGHSFNLSFKIWNV